MADTPTATTDAPANGAAEKASGSSPTTLPQGLLDLAVKAGASLFTAAGFLGFVALTGGAIAWVRFNAAGLPADQAVAAFPRRELLVSGAGALTVFFILGLLALAAVYALDQGGRPTDPMRRGLMVLTTVEVLLVIALVSEPVLERIAGGVLLVGVGCLGLLTAYFPDKPNWVSKLRDHLGLGHFSKPARIPPTAEDLDFAKAQAQLEKISASAAAEASYANALALLAEVAGSETPAFRRAATKAEAAARRSEAAAQTITLSTKPQSMRLNARGLVVQSFVMVALAGFLWWFLDTWWVAGAVLAATFLGTLCLGVSRATGSRFWPYGIAVLFSVLLFGAAVTIMRTYDSPKVQPAALIRRGDLKLEGLQGLYITENDQRVYLGTIARDCDSRRAVEGSGRVFWVPKDQTVAVSIGALQGISRAQRRAKELLEDLIKVRVPEVPAPAANGGDQGPTGPSGPTGVAGVVTSQAQKTPNPESKPRSKDVQPAVTGSCPPD